MDGVVTRIAIIISTKESRLVALTQIVLLNVPENVSQTSHVLQYRMNTQKPAIMIIAIFSVVLIHTQLEVVDPKQNVLCFTNHNEVRISHGI